MIEDLKELAREMQVDYDRHKKLEDEPGVADRNFHLGAAQECMKWRMKLRYIIYLAEKGCY